MNGKLVVALKGLIIHKGKCLILKRAKEDYGGDTWEPVGGKMEFGETMEDALKREIFEETGLSVKVGKLLYATSFFSNPDRQLVLLTYLCEAGTSSITLSSEHTDYRWVNKDELTHYLPQNILDDFQTNQIFELEELQ